MKSQTSQPIKTFAAGGNACVISTLNGDTNVPFFKEFANAGLTSENCPVLTVSWQLPRGCGPTGLSCMRPTLTPNFLAEAVNAFIGKSLFRSTIALPATATTTSPANA